MATVGCKPILILFLLVSTATACSTADAADPPTLRVCSAWEPDEAIALATAEAKLREALRQWLVTTRPSTTAIALPENLTQLLAFPDIQRSKTIERRERPYGTVARVHLSVHLSPATIEEWRTQALDEAQQRRLRKMLKVVGTLGSLVLLLATVYVLDVWTRGYRRQCLGMLLAAMTAVILAVALTIVK